MEFLAISSIEPRDKPWLYFIQEGGDDGLVKVGLAKNPRRRVGELQTGNGRKLRIIAAMPDADEHIEAMVHGKLRQGWCSGEWYTVEIVDEFLSSLA